jgi:hypothetical protein
VLAAASLVLTQAGEGSSPSGLTDGTHLSSSGEDSAFVMRGRGFESHRVLCGSLTIQRAFCTHDVVVACCLAMAEVRVRLPLGALEIQDAGKPAPFAN